MSDHLGTFVVTVSGGIFVGLVFLYIGNPFQHAETVNAEIFVSPFVNPARPRGLAERPFKETISRSLAKADSDVIGLAEDYDVVRQLPEAGCAFTTFITNNTSHPAKDVKIKGTNVVGFTVTTSERQQLATDPKRVTTFAPVLTIPAIDPTETIKIVVYTEDACTYDDNIPQKLNVFTNTEQGVKTDYTTFPSVIERSQKNLAAFWSLCTILGFGVFAIIAVAMLGKVFEKLNKVLGIDTTKPPQMPDKTD